jgi:predicted RecB family endonuclease
VSKKEEKEKVAQKKVAAKKTVASNKVTKKTAAKKTATKKKVAARSTAPKGTGAKPMISPRERYEMIATMAYYRAEQRNFDQGHDVEDWLECERIIDQMLSN